MTATHSPFDTLLSIPGWREDSFSVADDLFFWLEIFWKFIRLNSKKMIVNQNFRVRFFIQKLEIIVKTAFYG